MQPDDQVGYYHWPCLAGDRLFFLSEGDIWRTHMNAGGSSFEAHRLSDGLGAVTSLAVWPGDEPMLAFGSTRDGASDLYVMSARGGAARRLTHLEGRIEVCGFKDAHTVVVRSSHASAFRSQPFLYEVSLATLELTQLPFGQGSFAHFWKGGVFLERYGYGYTSWKGYRGGLAGEIWSLTPGSSKKKWTEHRLFQDIAHNVLCPLVVGERLYFVSDFKGRGNLYSATLQGDDIVQHTFHKDFYVRHVASDGKRLVYQKGGEIGVFDPASNEDRLLNIRAPSPCAARVRTFEEPNKQWADHSLSPDGQAVCVVTRGRIFVGHPFKGPMVQLGQRQGVRYRLAVWQDNEHVIVVRDQGTEDVLEIVHVPTLTSRELKGSWGRLWTMLAAPSGAFVVASNHQHHFLYIDLADGTTTKFDESPCGRCNGLSIAPDSRLIVYSVAITHQLHAIKFCALTPSSSGKRSGKITFSTWTMADPVLGDVSPVFDTKGTFVSFLSRRTAHEELDRTALRLCVLKASMRSPFVLPQNEDEKDDIEQGTEKTKSKAKGVPPVQVDATAIAQRLVDFPLPEADMHGTWAAPGRLFFLRQSEDSVQEKRTKKKPKGYDLVCFEFASLKEDVWMSDVVTVRTTSDGAWMSVVTTDKRLRVIKTTEKPDDEDRSFREGGWLDWDRIALEVEPAQEWVFMFSEAWRLQKELFWDSKMGKVDWDDVKKRYSTRLPRLRTAAELEDVIAEMHGELGVSHAYTWGFDQGEGADYDVGLLAADVKAAPRGDGVVIEHIYEGDARFEDLRSPLGDPGVNLKPGDTLLAVDGRVVSSKADVTTALVAKAGADVALYVRRKGAKKTETVWVQPLSSLRGLHYAAFVAKNTAYVHEQSKGRVGYIHIPDMAEAGYQAFYKAYAHEFDYEALVIDVRFNGGGNISTQLLSQLMRKRLGFDQSRHEGQIPYMLDSPRGPMVTLCNAQTGSDGDVFAHCFKSLKLGPVIGKRTWGGVIGISPQNPLLDGSWTSQPEYAIWFHDVGWQVENHGAEPDIEVDLTPADAAAGKDPQLDRGIKEALALLKAE